MAKTKKKAAKKSAKKAPKKITIGGKGKGKKNTPATDSQESGLNAEQIKNREKMLEALHENTDNVDIQGIIILRNAATEEGAALMDKHYERNGSQFINAVFNGDIEKAHEHASESDKEVLSDLL